MKKTALILVDFQNDYFSSFKDAKWELTNTEETSANAFKILKKFREKSMSIIHIKHEFKSKDAPFFVPNSQGAKIHSSVFPKDGEMEVLKNEVNSYKGTNLKEILDSLEIENLIIVGAMSHMCIDAITRASSDYGYSCFVAHDACATLDLEFNGIKVPAKMVHASFMSALSFAYAKVESTKDILELI